MNRLWITSKLSARLISSHRIVSYQLYYAAVYNRPRYSSCPSVGPKLGPNSQTTRRGKRKHSIERE